MLLHYRVNIYNFSTHIGSGTVFSITVASCESTDRNRSAEVSILKRAAEQLLLFV